MNQTNVYESLAGVVGLPQSKFIKEVYKRLVTPEEGEMLLVLPATVSEFARNFKINESAAKQKLDEFVAKGVAISRERAGRVTYCNPAHPIQLHDTSSYATLYEKYKPVQREVLELWRRFRETEWFECIRTIEYAGMVPSRVIPLLSSVEDTSGMLPYEDIRAILKEAPAIAVNDCPCRWLRVKEGNCDKPTWTCLHLSPSTVKFLLDNGLGKKISADEAYQVCDNAAEAGLCPTVSGGGPKVANICFCCSDCCVVLRPVVKYGYSLLSKSRYLCTVDSDLCNGCLICDDRCQFGAIKPVKVTGSKEMKASVDVEKCYGCGSCVIGCPTKAMTLKLVRPVEYIPMSPSITALDDIEAVSLT
jgi:electron transport complex protein RnfB